MAGDVKAALVRRLLSSFCSIHRFFRVFESYSKTLSPFGLKGIVTKTAVSSTSGKGPKYSQVSEILKSGVVWVGVGDSSVRFTIRSLYCLHVWLQEGHTCLRSVSLVLVNH